MLVRISINRDRIPVNKISRLPTSTRAKQSKVKHILPIKMIWLVKMKDKRGKVQQPKF